RLCMTCRLPKRGLFQVAGGALLETQVAGLALGHRRGSLVFGARRVVFVGAVIICRKTPLHLRLDAERLANVDELVGVEAALRGGRVSIERRPLRSQLLEILATSRQVLRVRTTFFPFGEAPLEFRDARGEALLLLELVYPRSVNERVVVTAHEQVDTTDALQVIRRLSGERVAVDRKSVV